MKSNIVASLPFLNCHRFSDFHASIGLGEVLPASYVYGNELLLLILPALSKVIYMFYQGIV